MRKRLALTALALVLVASLGEITTASAAPATKAQAQVLGNIVRGEDGTASVTARYICPEGLTLWVSAKQAEGGQPDQALRGEGSSQLANAWYESHPTEFTCDGTWQTDTFQISRFERGFGELEPGQAWVQFCLIGENTFISETRWIAVR